MSESLRQALVVIAALPPSPCRAIAKRLRISSQAVATRIWRLREMGLAAKVGPELYAITDAGRALLDGGGPENLCVGS